MLKKLVKKIIDGDFPSPSIPQWIAGFTAVVVIRSFIEIFSNTPYSGIVVSNLRRVHYFICFVVVALILSLVVSIFTKQRGNRVINLALYGLPIIFLAPIIDLILTKGGVAHMSYIADTGPKLFADYLTFGGVGNGATPGMQIEVFLILCAIGWYVQTKSKKIISTVVAVLVSYTLMFIIGALPGILYTVSHIPLNGADTSAVTSFMQRSVAGSNIPTNILHGELLYSTPSVLSMNGRNTLLSQVLYLLFFIFGLAWFWYAHKKTALAVLGNIRTTRIFLCLSLLGMGSLSAYSRFPIMFTWVDWLSFTVLSLSWFSACMFATHVNDLADIEIDKISNPDRPLPRGAVTVREMHEISYVWLLLSLIGAYIVGYFAFFMSAIFISAYYLYSAPPFRLKQVPLFSSFLISIAVLATVFAGFFFVSSGKIITEFPVSYAIGILIIFTLGVNIRDIKDVEGDRKAGIKTLPVIFGKYGNEVVGFLLALSFILAPFFLPFFTTYSIALPTAIIGYWLCVRKPYKERYIFFLFFVFCLVSIFFH
ncbi:MAG: UbiA family prenyltransferase [Candidatus Paceibacterota bacterium]|jgi:4-hydroxybenzoate polyprenyltransferase